MPSQSDCAARAVKRHKIMEAGEKNEDSPLLFCYMVAIILSIRGGGHTFVPFGDTVNPEKKCAAVSEWGRAALDPDMERRG